jgi:hypothetical protein
MKIQYRICLLVLIALSAEHNMVADDYLEYKIPPAAVKLDPTSTILRTKVVYYMVPGSDFSSHANVLGKEEYSRKIPDRLIKRELFKNGLMHGVQRTWHENGNIRSESPYKEGVMHGVFLEWDENGRLVARYEIQDGNGVKTCYDGDGRLRERSEIQGSSPNGRVMLLFDTSLISFGWKAHGTAIKPQFRFYSTGQLGQICFWNEEGKLHGPSVRFAADGSTENIWWFIRDQEVKEAEYKRISMSTKREGRDFSPLTLPHHHSDPQKYKTFVTEDVKVLLNQYLKLPRVKIPLEFDKDGKPVPAE